MLNFRRPTRHFANFRRGGSWPAQSATAVLIGLTVLSGCAPTPVVPPSVDTASTLTPDKVEKELALRLDKGLGVQADRAAALGILREGADRGDTESEMMLGSLYLQGVGSERQPQLAAAWLQKSVDGGGHFAGAVLAGLYLRGDGVAKDDQRARTILEHDAAAGSPSAETLLAGLYHNGRAVARDDHKAIELLRKAADTGSAGAMMLLGQASQEGWGVTADKVAAYAWFDLATSVSFSSEDKSLAQKYRDDLALVLLPADLARGKRLARVWKPGADMASLSEHLPAGNDAPVATPGALAGTTAPPAFVAAPEGEKKTVVTPTAIRLSTTDVVVHPDATSEYTEHLETEIHNDGAAHQFSQVPLTFDSERMDLTVTEAYTLKPNGTRLAVDSSAIYTQQAPGAPSLPMFTSLKAKVIVFPRVEAGDVLVYTSKIVVKPLFPKTFLLYNYFREDQAQNDVRVTVRVPKTLPLLTETHGMAASDRLDGDTHVYEWRYSHPVPNPEVKLALDPLDRLPRLFVSSFKSYDDMAKSYVELSSPAAASTPDVVKLADQITEGVTDRRRQTQLIYDWVSRNIRYVGLEMGLQAIVPHAAGSVITNGYGDCKDHSILFVALLRAKHIPAEVVLINLGNSFALPTPPVIGALNHEIVWLPELGTYADTTAGVAPFGVLPFGEYGKPVIHATTTGQTLRRTPTLAPGTAEIRSTGQLKISPDGSSTGDISSVGTGAFAVVMRQMANAIQTAGTEAVATRFLASQGYDGSGTFTFEQPNVMTSDYTVGSHFSAKPNPVLLSAQGFVPHLGLSLSPRPGDALLGGLDFADYSGAEPTPCYPGREVEELSIELPPGKRLRELPKGGVISDDYMTFKSDWTQVGQVVTVRRDFTSMVKDSVCIGMTRQVVARDLNRIRGDYATEIAIVGN